MFSSHLKKVKRKINESLLEGFLITSLPHVRYVSSFSGTKGICLITSRQNYLLLDSRYTIQAKKEVSGFNIVTAKDDLFTEISNRKLIQNDIRIGIDGNTMFLSQLKELRKLFPKVHFIPKANFIDEIAAKKDRSEIEQIKKATVISDMVFEKILHTIKPGIRELDIAAEISYLHKTLGADRDGFEPIVASGINSALPHARASSKKIRNNEIVTLDFGCVVTGYHSDLTRTIFIGKPKRKALKIFEIVLEAQLKAIAAAKSGMPVKDLDAISRNHIKKAGYGEYFGHALGHGIGLQIHEQPKISGINKAMLEEGNVITIEPGIYIPDFGGVRIEDDIVIKNNSSEVLTKASKEICIL
jgi:Xaa-Pro aminopeptidase